MPDHSSSVSIRTHGAFRVDVHPEREVVRVAPVGALDAAGATELVGQLRELRDAGFVHIVLDLHGLQLVDLSAFGSILTEVRLARDSGVDCSLTGAAPALQRVLDDGIAEATHAVASTPPAVSAAAIG